MNIYDEILKKRIRKQYKPTGYTISPGQYAQGQETREAPTQTPQENTQMNIVSGISDKPSISEQKTTDNISNKATLTNNTQEKKEEPKQEKKIKFNPAPAKARDNDNKTIVDEMSEAKNKILDIAKEATDKAKGKETEEDKGDIDITNKRQEEKQRMIDEILRQLAEADSDEYWEAERQKAKEQWAENEQEIARKEQARGGTSAAEDIRSAYNEYLMRQALGDISNKEWQRKMQNLTTLYELQSRERNWEEMHDTTRDTLNDALRDRGYYLDADDNLRDKDGNVVDVNSLDVDDPVRRAVEDYYNTYYGGNRQEQLKDVEMQERKANKEAIDKYKDSTYFINNFINKIVRAKSGKISDVLYSMFLYWHSAQGKATIENILNTLQNKGNIKLRDIVEMVLPGASNNLDEQELNKTISLEDIL